MNKYINKYVYSYLRAVASHIVSMALIVAGPVAARAVAAAAGSVFRVGIDHCAALKEQEEHGFEYRGGGVGLNTKGGTYRGERAHAIKTTESRIGPPSYRSTIALH